MIRNNCKIEWVDLDEGYDGQYDETDPEDKPLLRFDVYERENKRAEWKDVDDASYCTQVPVTTPKAMQKRLLNHLMDNIEPELRSGNSIKKMCERLSWITPEWLA